MASKIKRITMAVTVSVPRWMSSSQARREVRSLINHQAGWLSHGPDYEDVTVRAVKVGPAT